MDSAAQEIEVKYRLIDHSRIEELLAERGLILSEAVIQDDQAYAPTTWHYGMSKQGVSFARLRTQGGSHLFTLKQPVDNEMACLEYETPIVDRAQMHEAILLMGFSPTVRIVKTRRTACVGDLSICLDEVEHAGCFLEVERGLPPGCSGREVQAELDDFVQSFGIPVERLHDTYDSLVHARSVEV